MEAKHTPGEWVIGYGGQEGDTYATIVSKYADHPIAQIEPVGYNVANARLIAAAPCLMEALQNALNVMAGVATGDLATIKRDSPAIAAARAALAKATNPAKGE